MNRSLLLGALLSFPLLIHGDDPVVVAQPATREIKITASYLRLPVKNGARVRHLAISCDGRPEPKIDIPLADAAPDWWAWKNVAPFRGRTLSITTNDLPAGSTALSSIDQTDQIAPPADLYAEPLRPQCHFSSQQGWLNDPNGLVYYRGEYHLFYQLNPYGNVMGNQHWGHAVSPDLVHWQELPVALYPDSMGLEWSGSGVVDWKNTSGLGQGGEPPLVLFYTAAGTQFGQCLAYSQDGRTISKYSGNPVVPQIVKGNRDPKVIRYEPTHSWVMVIYAGIPTGEFDKKGKPKLTDTIQFLTSPDLKTWTATSQVIGFHECPDLYELPVDGNPKNKKWVLTAGNSDYMVGTFDGRTFTPETPKLPGNPGISYAAQTFSDLPDGRRIRIGWLRAPSPEMPFNQEMSLPIELNLVTTPDGPRLTWTPVEELKKLRDRGQRIGPMILKPDDANPLPNIHSAQLEIRATFQPGDAQDVHFNVRGASIVYDTGLQEIIVNGVRSKAPLRDGQLDLAIYLDRTSIEVFAASGLVYLAKDFIPQSDDDSMEMSVSGGETKITSIEVYPLHSIWK